MIVLGAKQVSVSVVGDRQRDMFCPSNCSVTGNPRRDSDSLSEMFYVLVDSFADALAGMAIVVWVDSMGNHLLLRVAVE